MSEEKKRRKRIVTELKYPLPDKHISFDSYFGIISAYVVASSNGKKEVGYKELEPYIKVNSNVVSGCTKFFHHLGLIEPGQKSSRYKSTSLAEELHNAIKWDNPELKKSTLAKILENTWFWNQTKQYLEVNKTSTRDQLIQKLGLGCGADPVKHKRAIEKLIDFMQTADLIQEKDEKFELSTKISQPLENQSIEKYQEPSIENKPKDDTVKLENKTMGFSIGKINLSFGLLINPETSEEQIRKTVRTVVDELEKIQKEKEASKDDTG